MLGESPHVRPALNLDDLFCGLEGDALLDRIAWVNRLLALVPLLHEPGMARALIARYDDLVARDTIAAIVLFSVHMTQHDVMCRIARGRELVPDVEGRPAPPI